MDRRDPRSIDPKERFAAMSVWQKFTECRSNRYYEDRPWLVYYRWLAGSTDLFWDPHGGSGGDGVVQRLLPRSSFERRSLPINYVRTITERHVAKQMKPRDIIEAFPAGDDEHDRQLARGARSLLRHHWHEQEITEKKRAVFTDRTTVGNGFMKVRFDPYKQSGPHEEVPVYEDCDMCEGSGMALNAVESEPLSMLNQALAGEAPQLSTTCPRCDGQGQIVSHYKTRALGDICVDHVRPNAIYVNPSATSMDDVQTLFHAYKIPKRLAAERFGMDAKEIRQAETMMFELSQGGFYGPGQKIGTQEYNDDVDEEIWFIEQWQPPLPGEQQPRLIIMAGDRIVWPLPKHEPEVEILPDMSARVPERYGQIPFVHFRYQVVPGHFWGQGLVRELISSNQWINQARHNFKRHMDMHAYIKTYVQAGTVAEDALTNRHGEIVEYEGSTPPTQGRLSTMPEFYRSMVPDEYNHMNDVAGLTEVDQGRAPPNIESGEALALLLESSEQSIAPMLIEDRAQYRRLGRMVLQCCRANYGSERRYMRILGDTRTYETQLLTGESYDENAVVEFQSVAPTANSKALAQAQLLNAIQSGIFDDDPETRREAIRKLEFGVVPGEVENEVQQQQALASRENDRLREAAEGGMPFDHGAESLQGIVDHKVHIKIHRTACVAALSRGDLDLAQALQQAVLFHEAQLAQVGGGMPGGPGPSGSLEGVGDPQPPTASLDQPQEQ